MTIVPFKTVIITGGTRGLGRSLSLIFGKAGFYVVSVYKSNHLAAESLENLFKEEGIEGVCVQQDVSLGSIDLKNIPNSSELILINNATNKFSPNPFHLNTWEDFSQSIDSSLKGACNCLLALLKPLLKAEKSCVINILSSAIKPPVPKGFSSYLAGKYALLGFTKSISSEYSHRGLRVFSISPGFMNTELTLGWSEYTKGSVVGNNDIMKTDVVAEAILNLYNGNIPAKGEDYLI
jgi:3-oxoacyl-[acyl-carrier protein] reductase